MKTCLAYAAVIAALLLMGACAQSAGTQTGSNDSIAIGGDGVPVDDANIREFDEI